MTTAIDTISRELEWLDPVYPGELDDALAAPAAKDLLEWLVSLEVDPASRRSPGNGPMRGADHGLARRPGTFVIPMLALAALSATALLLVVTLPGRGAAPGGVGAPSDRLGATLDHAAAVADAPRIRPVAGDPYTYRKTREISLVTSTARRRSWSVEQRTTREEWVGWDGSGMLRVVTAPTRFTSGADRAEWEAAGSPGFLALGFAGHTEDHWLAAGMLDRSFEQLPTGSIALATRLRHRAAAAHAGGQVPAATLQSIAEDLGEPGASPELRHALYEALKWVPGIRYLGATTDPEGRRGEAVGVAGTYAGRPAVFKLIFDPDTAAVLATETTSRAPGDSRAARPELLHARVYVESRGVGAASEAGDMPPTKFDVDMGRRPTTPYLVYAIPAPNEWSRTIDASFETGRSRG
ncbi:MAG TPA: hypothetical protein VHA76_06400 [Solirubrobacterales bacterium]|nr:hypothetical protein [Solirubrobacterales bacterium]